ncbi:MAG: hypothetical protein ABII00_00140 [Elusimicrobiota bacterium]
MNNAIKLGPLLLAPAMIWADASSPRRTEIPQQALRYAVELRDFARDLAAGQGASEVGRAEVDFAVPVIAPYGIGRVEGGLAVRCLRAPKEVIVPFESVSGEGAAPEAVRGVLSDGGLPFAAAAVEALTRHVRLYATVLRELESSWSETLARDWLRTSPGHFGLRPFGVSEGPPPPIRARASSLRYLRSLASANPDLGSKTAALALWRKAASLKAPGLSYVTGEDVLEAVRLRTWPGPAAARPPAPPRARDGAILAMLVALAEKDPALAALDPYAADRLVEALESLREGGLVLAKKDLPEPEPSSKPRLLFRDVTARSGLWPEGIERRTSVGGRGLGLRPGRRAGYIRMS